jgi:peptide/nickel transport system substrate-binding protein
VLSLTNDGLLGFRKTGGAPGLDVVPDLASALPDISADGLRYRFPLQSGVFYSNGDPVLPEDFRYGLERAFLLHPAAAGQLAAFQGAHACIEVPETCDLGEAVVTEADAVTFHLSVPDPDLPFKLAQAFASPVPAGTPLESQKLVPLPATGPYVFVEADKHHMVLERNPYFEEWSPAAQPDGFADRIEWEIRTDLEEPLDGLVRGELDAVTGFPPPDAIAEFRATHPEQLVQVAEPSSYYWLLDLTTPPFDDLRVRRAVNLAVDRARVQASLGGETAWRVSCQILPPNFPGYEPYCPHTVSPGAAWSGPDPEEARRLIEEAGAAGTPVRILASGVPIFPGTPEVARYFEDLLDRLGFDASVEFIDDVGEYFDAIDPDVRRGVQMFEFPWYPDFPAASGFINLLYGCGGSSNIQPFCDRGFDRGIAEAQRLAPIDPAAANAAWAELDRELVDRAISVPLLNGVRSYAFSDRVGNAQINPQYGLLLSRLWVR